VSFEFSVELVIVSVGIVIGHQWKRVRRAASWENYGNLGPPARSP